MILLTDEEIRDAIWPLRKEQGKEVYVSLADKNIAKAQLKKVVEYLEHNSSYDESLRDSSNGSVHIRGEVWFALLEEVK